VARSPIVTREDVLDCCPDAPAGFVPTHRVEVLHPRDGRVLRSDLVRLAETDDISYAVDARGEEIYGVLPTGLWQCLEIHGRVLATPVRYRESYVPFMERRGVVYFMREGADGPIKIGWSQNTDARRAGLQTANPRRLQVIGHVPGTRRDEANLHARFSHLRMEGEWFRNCQEIHDYLRDHGEDPISPP